MNNEAEIQAIANQIQQEDYDTAYHPVVGETWMYQGKLVQITGGTYWGNDPTGRGRLLVSNFWEFRHVDDGARGSCYDNDRTVFYNPEKEGVQPGSRCDRHH